MTMNTKEISTYPLGEPQEAKVLGVDSEGNTVLIKTEDILLNSGNLVPTTQRLDANEEFGSSTSSAFWSSFQSGNPTIENGAVKISAFNDIEYSGVRADGLLATMTNGKEYIISFDLKSNKNINLYLTGAGGAGIFEVVCSTDTKWAHFEKQITMSNTYTRLQISKIVNTTYSNNAYFIKNFAIKEKIGVDASNFRHNLYFNGKKLSIIGDSISTCNGTNATQFTVLQSDIDNSVALKGYPTTYDVGKTIGGTEVTSAMVGVETTFTPVAGDLGKTIGQVLNYGSLAESNMWWKLVADSLKMSVLANVSWSGASISSHEGDKDDYKTSYSWHPSQIAKLAQRDSNGDLQTPDVIIIYRGTNDFSHSPISLLGSYSAESTEVPVTDYSDNVYKFKDAYAILISKLRETYPKADIFICTLNVFKRVTYDHYPTRNSSYTLPQMNNAIREIADAMGVGLIEFDKDGITFENCYSEGYITDSDTTPTHPNAKGHTQMAKKAVADMLAYITSL